MQLRIEKCVIDLYWEYDRMSSSGQATLDRLAKMSGLPTQADMDKKFDHLSKDQLLKELEEL
jgi:hypothetical protein|tara:strand:+ start:934 stop:1119 length:186 start_codon:yes stop_codon:yes gene_type:complete